MRFFLIIIIFIYSKGYSQDLIVRYSCNQGYSVGNLIIFEDNSLWQIQASDKEGTEETLIIQTNSTDEYYLVKSYSS
ncbi:MAG: hypothetical protein SFU27_08765, partial [Thermonemataceae bacterium]|nr:hypothetical protein [Thermonemataceae bacterium]